jgi:hypothetical protein
MYRVAAALVNVRMVSTPAEMNLPYESYSSAPCHATVERLQRVDRYLPPLLQALWREQHPNSGEQLAFALDAPGELTTDGLEEAAGSGEPL